MEQIRKDPVLAVPYLVRLESARDVVLTGDFTGWTPTGIPLTRGPNGQWSTTLQLRPGEYQYRLIVDGEWRNDPQAVKRVPNPYGSENSVLNVKRPQTQRAATSTI
jgi:AMP-activated protein kinase-like protein